MSKRRQDIDVIYELSINNKYLVFLVSKRLEVHIGNFTLTLEYDKNITNISKSLKATINFDK